jgi:hypothetical protein
VEVVVDRASSRRLCYVALGRSNGELWSMRLILLIVVSS